MSTIKKELSPVVLILLGIVIGVVIAPHIPRNHSYRLIQKLELTMGDYQGEVLGIEGIPGTNLQAIKVIYDFKQPFKGLIRTQLGAIIRKDDNIEIGDMVTLMDVIHFNTGTRGPLWARLLKTEPFEEFDYRGVPYP